MRIKLNQLQTKDMKVINTMIALREIDYGKRDCNKYSADIELRSIGGLNVLKNDLSANIKPQNNRSIGWRFV